MARHPRIEGQALAYYVSCRGRNNLKIFKDDQDKIYFINLIKQQRIKSKLTFYGYVLLPDLYGCLMETRKNNFIQSMHRINSDYANYLNRRHRYKCKLFHDRYKCYVIDKKNYLAEISRHLHLLPVKAGMVSTPIHYEWSSYPGYIYKKKREDWIAYSTILSIFDGTERKAAYSYQKYVDMGVKKRIASPFKDLKEGIILGGEEFKKELHEKVSRNEIILRKEELNLAKSIIELVNQPSFWPSLKRRGRKHTAISLARNAAIYFIKRFTDLNNYQISQFFQSLEKSSISQMSRRFKLAKEKNPSLEKISRALESRIKAIVLGDK